MNNNFYKNFDSPKRNHFSCTVLVAFICSFITSLLTLLCVFSIPSVKSYLLNLDGPVDTVSTSVNSAITDNQYISSLPTGSFSDTAIYAANKVLPSIVGITVDYTSNYLAGSQTSEAQGSGIIISSDGYILTNNHIISATSSSYYEVSKASSINVSLYNDDAVYSATIVGKDEETDLAVIKIDKSNLTVAEFGDSNNIQVGQFVLAVGNPLGLERSVTFGIVSGMNRTVSTSDSKYLLIQTDAAINSGNSGGALVNSKGQVIGINTLKLSGTGVEGMGFAIPINDTIDISDQLIQHGKVLRPYIGISGSSLDEYVAARYNLPTGIYVQAVDVNSGAQDAGIKVGDVLISIDDIEIKTMDYLNEIKEGKKIGDKLKVVVYRNSEYITLTLTLTEAP